MMTVDYRILLVAVLEPCALLFSVVGNIIVIYVMTRSEKLTKQSNFYIVSLAIIDLLSGLITIPLAVFSLLTAGPNSKTECLTLCSIMIAIFTISLFSLVAVSVDRYFAICHHLSYRKAATKTTTGFVIVLCWLSGLMGFLPLFGWHKAELINFEGDINKCHLFVVLDRNFIVFMSVCVFLIPTSVLLTVYALIYKKIKKQRHKEDALESFPITQENATKTLSMVMGSFIVCWLPMMITIFIVGVTKGHTHEDSVLRMIFNVCVLLSHFNAAINPLIYGFRIKDVRLVMTNILHCRCNKRNSGGRHTFSAVNSNNSMDNELRVKCETSTQR